MRWPFTRRTTILSALTCADARELLRKSTRSAWSLNLRRPEPFVGTVEEGGFKLVRSAWFGNSWRPVLVGTIREGAAGAEVEVFARLARPMAILMVPWLGMPAFLAVMGPLQRWRLGGEWHAMDFAGLALFAVFLGISNGLFELEWRASRRALERALALSR